jgi:hypothetical protein
MTRAYYKVVAALLCGAALLVPHRAAAAIMADPQELYRQMNAAYQRGAAQGWSFFNREYYLATVFDAGRAYALQRPQDPSFSHIEQLTVDLATELHYDPLINHEAVEWYVRQAASDVQKNSGDPAEAQKASALLARVDALDDPQALARLADADAQANLQAYPRDDGALLQRAEADWRAWLLTRDDSWRNLAFLRASQFGFPIANLPQTWGPAFMQSVRAAAAGSSGYSTAERDNADVILQYLKKAMALPTIANVNSRPSHAFQMTILAPADEYFGPMGMSILGIRNELHRINAMIGYGYGKQESAAALEVAVSIDDLHKVYPRDRAVPELLYDAMTVLGKIGTPDALAGRAHLRSLLTVEYQDSKQAQEILNGA